MGKTRSAMYCIIYRLRKRQARINTKTRTIFYIYNNETDEKLMRSSPVIRLCLEWGFVRQSEIN